MVTLLGSAAFADRWHGAGGGGYRGGYARPVYHGAVYNHRPSYSYGYGRGYGYGYGGGYYRPAWGGAHYYNYWRRPALIVEPYSVMPGYIWVRGHWSWNGYEWMWQPGHYAPAY
jgi:hypothetical protein